MKLGLLSVLLSAGCGWSVLPAGSSGTTLEPQRAVPAPVEAVALRADELRVDSLGLGTMADAGGLLIGPAADLLRRNRLRVQRLQEHFETVVDARDVVHWATASGAATAVVATSGRRRLLGPDAVSAWDNFAEQWQYTVRWSAGWRVWSAIELPPAEWWPA